MTLADSIEPSMNLVEDPLSLRDTARSAYNAKDWKSAAEHWTRHLQSKPVQQEGYYKLARSCAKLGWLSKADDAFEILIAQPELDGSYLRKAGRLAIDLHGVPRAVTIYNRLARERPEDYALEMSDAVGRKDMLAQAALLAAAEPDQAPTDPPIDRAELSSSLYARGRAHEDRDRAVEAFRSFDAAVILDPGLAKAAHARTRVARDLHASGLAHLALGEIASSRQVFETLVRLEPGNDKYWKGLGRILSRARDWAPARLAWERVVALNSMDGEANRQLARAAEKSQAFDTARAAWARCLQLNPNDADALKALQEIDTRILRSVRDSLKAGAPLEAMRMFNGLSPEGWNEDVAKSRFRQTQTALRRSARQLYTEGRYASAVEYGLVLHRSDPLNADYAVILARAAMRAKFHDMARAAYVAALDAGAEATPAIYSALVNCALRLGDLRQAELYLVLAEAAGADPLQSETLRTRLEETTRAAVH